jgi:hypothetical protein
MARRGYLVFAVLAACVGCRGTQSPADSVAPGVKEELARSGLTGVPSADARNDAAVPPTPRPPFPAGAWTTTLADGCQIILYLEENAVRIVMRTQYGHLLTCDGHCSVPDAGIVVGILTDSDLKGPNLEMSSRTSRPFDLRYALDGEQLVITQFTGGGWDARGAQQFCARYLRAQPVENSLPR